MLAAACADPLVESISNSGVFGRGTFTDHSTLDVLPTVLAGGLVVLLLVVYRVWNLGRCEDLTRGGILRLLPIAFALQIAVLFTIETAEQWIVWHHFLGGAIWLGGPAAFSLSVHAAFCTAIVFALARALPLLAETAIVVVRLIRALATLAVDTCDAIARTNRRSTAFCRPMPLLCRIGERAPPGLLTLSYSLEAFGEFTCFHRVRFVSASSPSPVSLRQ